MLKKIKTEKGFECEIDTELLDDIEFMDMLLATQEGDTLMFVKLMKYLLGEEQYKKAKDFIRNENGRAKLTDMFTLFEEIFESIGKDAKN